MTSQGKVHCKKCRMLLLSAQDYVLLDAHGFEKTHGICTSAHINCFEKLFLNSYFRVL